MTLRFLSSYIYVIDSSRELVILLSYCYIFKAKWIHSVCLTYCICIISINRLFHGSLDNWIIFVDFRISLLRRLQLCSIYRNCAFCVIRSRSSLRDSRLYGWVLLLHISCYCGGFVTRYIIPNIPIILFNCMKINDQRHH